MQEVRKLAQSISEPNQICFTDISVSIHGASGTGKELFADAIHTASKRHGPFVPINCAALPEHLLESELFGYVSGAFTGGKKNGKPGLFEFAENGTVFLDEIAEMPLGSQAKMLRLIQEKAVRRIGGSKEIPINTRIITATNKNLESLVENQTFRKDLYYRISVLPIHISPLNQRIDDIPILVEHFLFLLASKLGKKIPGLTEAAFDKLYRHEWPGNVRELKNVVERAALLCEEQKIDVKCILFSHELGQMGHTQNRYYAGTNQSLKEQVAEFEKNIIVETFKSKKSVRQTARSLEISHPALLKKMKMHGLKTSKKVTIGNK